MGGFLGLLLSGAPLPLVALAGAGVLAAFLVCHRGWFFEQLAPPAPRPHPPASSPASPVPGWHPDSAPGVVRWWDGVAWTGFVAAEPPTYLGAAGPGWYPDPDRPVLLEWDGSARTGRELPAHSDGLPAGKLEPGRR
jgi:hypothetical protein